MRYGLQRGVGTAAGGWGDGRPRPEAEKSKSARAPHMYDMIVALIRRCCLMRREWLKAPCG